MLSVTWTNESSLRWNRGQNEYNPPPNGRMSQLPQDVLQPRSGMTSMTMTVTGQDAANAGEQICVWWAQIPNSSGSNAIFWFGTQLYQPINFVHMGFSPYYAICSGQVASVEQIPQLKMESITLPPSPGEDLWRRPVDEPGDPYYFTAATDQLPKNLKIGFVPTASGEDIEVEVTISDIVIVITPKVLPAGTVGTGYAQPLMATGDASTYTFTCQNPPPGLVLTSTGMLAGHPTSSGVYVFDVRATDPQGNYADITYNLSVSRSRGEETEMTEMKAPLTLLFTFVNGSWSARLANTDVAYTVVGDTPDEQLQVLRGMAELMEEGQVGVYDDMFVDPPAAGIDDVLFRVSSGISVDALGGAPGDAWAAEEGATVFTDISEAGEMLLTFL